VFVSDTLYLVEKSLKRQKNIKFLVCGLLIILAFVGIFYVPHLLEFSQALALCLVLGTVIFVSLQLMRNAQKLYYQEVYFWTWLLHKNKENIVWVYYFKLENMPFGVQFNQQTTFFVHLSNRDCLSIRMSEKDILLLMKYMRQFLTNATFGYSAHKKQLYDISPDLLRKEE